MMTKSRYSRTTSLVVCGLFAALTAICSYISIPLGFTPVPVTLGTLAVFLAGGILGKKYGTLSITVYVILGAVGVPVFAGFRGGIGVLAGPTGGYIIGYIAAAFIVGFFTDMLIANKLSESVNRISGKAMPENPASADDLPERSAPPKSQPKSSQSKAANVPLVSALSETVIYALSMILGLAACYALGSAWYMISTGTPLWTALVSCVIPFLAGDALKIAAASILVRKLRPMINWK